MSAVNTEQEILRFLTDRLENNPNLTSKYEQLSSAMKDAISQSILQPGAGLPAERVLSKNLGLSRITVRKAIDQLADDGLVVRRHGARTSVAERVKKQISNLIGFSEEIRMRGMVPSTRVLEIVSTTPTAREREKLELGRSEEVVVVKRVRLANNRPIALERAVVPLAIVKSCDAIGNSLYATLDAVGASPDRGIQRIFPAKLSAEESVVMETQENTLVLMVERLCYTAENLPVEFTVTKYNAGVFDFTNELQR